LDKCIIIAAGGRGERMNAGIPKQFVLLAGKPLLMHTLEIFSTTFNDIRILLVLPQDMFATWEKLVRKYRCHVAHELVAGGPTRFQSVKNALRRVTDGMLVGIHDGVRPMVRSETIRRLFDVAEAHGHAVPALPCHDSIRQLGKDSNYPVDRDLFRIIQTPQVFLSTLIKQAYDQDDHEGFTDDATVLESMGVTIRLVEGDPENIKITTLQDLMLAEALMAQRPH
jgi:2-C-methyl-D-erythritol 4-phosphate cytidylyltransferase